MKKIDSVEIVNRKLTYFQNLKDYTQIIECTGIKWGDILIFNNCEGVFNHHNEDFQIFQTFICESDGISGCEFGNWVAFRKYKDWYLFIPAIKMIYSNKWTLLDCAPPDWVIQSKYIVYFDDKIFQIFKEHIPAFKKLKTVRKLSKWEIKELDEGFDENLFI